MGAQRYTPARPHRAEGASPRNSRHREVKYDPDQLQYGFALTYSQARKYYRGSTRWHVHVHENAGEAWYEQITGVLTRRSVPLETSPKAITYVPYLCQDPRYIIRVFMDVYAARKAGSLPGWRDLLWKELVLVMRFMEAQEFAIDRSQIALDYKLLPLSKELWTAVCAFTEPLKKQWRTIEVDHKLEDYREPANLGVRPVPESVGMGIGIRSASSENDPMGCEVIPPLTPPGQVTHGASPPPAKRTRLARERERQAQVMTLAEQAQMSLGVDPGELIESRARQVEQQQQHLAALTATMGPLATRTKRRTEPARSATLPSPATTVTTNPMLALHPYGSSVTRAADPFYPLDGPPGPPPDELTRLKNADRLLEFSRVLQKVQPFPLIPLFPPAAATTPAQPAQDAQADQHQSPPILFHCGRAPNEAPASTVSSSMGRAFPVAGTVQMGFKQGIIDLLRITAAGQTSGGGPEGESLLGPEGTRSDAATPTAAGPRSGVLMFGACDPPYISSIRARPLGRPVPSPTSLPHLTGPSLPDIGPLYGARPPPRSHAQSRLSARAQGKQPMQVSFQQDPVQLGGEGSGSDAVHDLGEDALAVAMRQAIANSLRNGNALRGLDTSGAGPSGTKDEASEEVGASTFDQAGAPTVEDVPSGPSAPVSAGNTNTEAQTKHDDPDGAHAIPLPLSPRADPATIDPAVLTLPRSPDLGPAISSPMRRSFATPLRPLALPSCASVGLSASPSPPAVPVAIAPPGYCTPVLPPSVPRAATPDGYRTPTSSKQRTGDQTLTGSPKRKDKEKGRADARPAEER